MSTSPPLTAQQRRLALALAVPAVIAAIAVAGVEIWRVAAPERAQNGYQHYASLGEASARDDVRGAYEFIRGGQDPNALISVYDPTLTGGEPVRVPPIVWAAAGARPKIMLMLLGAGATFERESDRAAPCLADQVGLPEIASTLRRLADLPPASTCPPAAPGPPLLSVGEPVAEALPSDPDREP